MKTDDLIRTLAADTAYRAAAPVKVLSWALIAAVPITLAGFALTLGPRADWRQAMGNPFFDLKFAVTLSLALGAMIAALRLARPGAEGSLRAVLAAPVVLLVAGIAADFLLAAEGGSAWLARLRGTNAAVCLTAIPLLAVPLLIGALAALRHGAAVRPHLTGAVAGLLAGGIAATFYAVHCTDDSPLFVATWYTLGILVVAAIGAAAGGRVLKF